MKRNEFIRKACSAGMCSCAGFSLLSAGSSGEKTSDAEKKLKQTMEFIQKRFARLMQGMNLSVSGETRKKILEDVGRSCAGAYRDSFIKFKNDPEGFLNFIKKDWAERTEYDKTAKTMRIIGHKTERCVCPFVEKSITPKEFCDCSIGFNKEALEIVFGKPVDVKIEESVLRGGERCTFIAVIK